jgi:hypothetical protein
MTEVNRSEDCGNSPKNRFVQELSIALALREMAPILEGISDDASWEVVGSSRLEGKAAFAEELRVDGPVQAESVTIHHVVTHGKAGAVNGTIRADDGSVRQFCDVYEFTSAKGGSVRAITSYVIDSQ